MALDGASIVFVAGAEVPLPLLRTRAAENRVYVAAASTKTAVLIGPDGRIIATLDADAHTPIVAEIDLRESAEQNVFAGTHIWQQRRPRLYAAAFGVTARFDGPID